MERIRQIRVEGRTARPGNNQMQGRRAGPQKLHALFGLGTWEGGCWYHSLTQGIQKEHQLRGGGGQKICPTLDLQHRQVEISALDRRFWR